MNRADLQQLSRIRVKEARILLNNGHYHGAYYLLGYSIECALKACIAKQINRYDFPDKELINKSYSHNLEQLLGLAGLADKLKDECTKNPPFELNWTTVKDWKESSRYEKIVEHTKSRDFYSACIARKHGILTWLRKWW